jgi:hypothetical protein
MPLAHARPRYNRRKSEKRGLPPNASWNQASDLRRVANQAAGLRWRIAGADHSRRIASLSAHLGGHRDLNELEVIGGGDLLVWQAAGNHHAVADAEPRISTAREFETQPLRM